METTYPASLKDYQEKQNIKPFPFSGSSELSVGDRVLVGGCG